MDSRFQIKIVMNKLIEITNYVYCLYQTYIQRRINMKQSNFKKAIELIKRFRIVKYKSNEVKARSPYNHKGNNEYVVIGTTQDNSRPIYQHELRQLLYMACFDETDATPEGIWSVLIHIIPTLPFEKNELLSDEELNNVINEFVENLNALTSLQIEKI